MSELDHVRKVSKWKVLFVFVLAVIGMCTLFFLLFEAGLGWLVQWAFWAYIAVWAFMILFGWTGKARIR